MFHFGDCGAITPEVIADIPAGISSKVALLHELAQQLRFPGYSGSNRDAFEECVRDLSWLPAGTVVVSHKDLPLANDVSNAKVYLSIVDDAVRKLSGDRLWVVFPDDTSARVAWLLQLARSNQSKQ